MNVLITRRVEAAAAAAILEKFADPETARLCREHAGIGPAHVWPDVLPVVARSVGLRATTTVNSSSAATSKQWRDTPPGTPGTYQWRRGSDWEPVARTFGSDRKVFSQRYEQLVAIERLGGQWLY